MHLSNPRSRYPPRSLTLEVPRYPLTDPHPSDPILYFSYRGSSPPSPHHRGTSWSGPFPAGWPTGPGWPAEGPATRGSRSGPATSAWPTNRPASLRTLCPTSPLRTGRRMSWRGTIGIFAPQRRGLSRWKRTCCVRWWGRAPLARALPPFLGSGRLRLPPLSARSSDTGTPGGWAG